MEYIIAAVVGIVGLVVGYFGNQQVVQKKANSLIGEANNKVSEILDNAKKEGEQIKKDRILQAKDKFLQLKQQHNDEFGKRRKRLEDGERELKKRQNDVKNESRQARQKEEEVKRIKSNLEEQLDLVTNKKEQLDEKIGQQVTQLEKIANLTGDEAKAQLIESMKEKARNEALSHIKEIADDAKVKANKEAKKIIIQTIQRTAAEQTIENTVAVFNLDSDDQKGQIIGREGRNIRALEAATGCEIVVDDTPEAIIISGYDPVRREVCRLSLQRLVADGRIHPARIEEIVRKTSKQIEEQILEIGERTVIELGITGMHNGLIRTVGRMRFRSSYGQNLLQHSKEVANLCATMAAELGIDPKMAKRAGLLHDIGKVPEEESELSHALLGAKWAQKYKEHPAIVNAIGAHHDEMEMKYLISPIIQACDAISGSRPGARREILESYLKRIKQLEQLALDYKGVQKAYAIQAGRELRVLVEAERVTDKKAEELSFDISQKIMEEMTYPGQVKVTVIRETRAVNYAK